MSVDCYLTSVFLNAKFLTHEQNWKIVKDDKNPNHVQMILEQANVCVFLILSYNLIFVLIF